jgi:hypothetical protein
MQIFCHKIGDKCTLRKLFVRVSPHSVRRQYEAGATSPIAQVTHRPVVIANTSCPITLEPYSRCERIASRPPMSGPSALEWLGGTAAMSREEAQSRLLPRCGAMPRRAIILQRPSWRRNGSSSCSVSAGNSAARLRDRANEGLVILPYAG